MGKPNAFMMRAALRYMQAHSEETLIVGDNMDTDIIAGIQSGLETVLVLSGVSRARGPAAATRTGRTTSSRAPAELLAFLEERGALPRDVVT